MISVVNFSTGAPFNSNERKRFTKMGIDGIPNRRFNRCNRLNVHRERRLICFENRICLHPERIRCNRNWNRYPCTTVAVVVCPSILDPTDRPWIDFLLYKSKGKLVETKFLFPPLSFGCPCCCSSRSLNWKALVENYVSLREIIF